MAILETIRVKIGWLITILIAVALLSFIVDFNSLSAAFQSSSDKYTVGKINGQKVSYKDFQEQVEYQSSIAELLGANTSEQQQKQIRDAAWQYFVDRDLFLKRAAQAGIEVGKDELKDLTVGEGISPVMRYDPVFGSQDGQFEASRVREFVSSMDSDESGNSRRYWDYVQNNVKVQQYYAKYGSLFAASDIVNPLAEKDICDGNNITSSISFVSVPFIGPKDSTIKVSNSEIKKYYSAHKDFYKQKANRDIAYAMFEVEPSQADKDAALSSIDEVYDEFKTASNVKNFIMRNSEHQMDSRYYGKGELMSFNDEVDEFVAANKSGVSPVFNDGNVYCAVRIVDTKAVPDSVFVRHILVRDDNALVDSLMGVLKKTPAKFTELAALYSADKGRRGAVPGELGWMTQTYMFPGMESVMFASVNKPFILDTQYGRHIVEVTKATKATTKKQVAILQKTAVPSKATMNEFYSKANTLATKAAGSAELLQSAASELGIYLWTVNVDEATDRYASVEKAKEVTRWVFEAKKGAASNVITVNQNYLFVVGVKDVHKEGYSSLAEVSDEIKEKLYSRKAADKKLAEVKAAVAGCTTITDVADALGQPYETLEDLAFSSMMGASAAEPALLGVAAGAKEGVVAAPVKGRANIYVAVVNSRNTGSFFTADDAKDMSARKGQYLSQMIVPAMLEQTSSVDNRERFY